MNLLEQETCPIREYREIPLTRNQVALIDDDDYEIVSRYKWYAFYVKKRQVFYAATNIMDSGKYKTLFMHRLILGLNFGDSRCGDHIETKRTLDNRRSNLRVATNTQNMWNSVKRKPGVSGFKGVALHGCGKWQAMIRIGNGKRVYLGLFPTVEEAREAYRQAALHYHGEFAKF